MVLAREVGRLGEPLYEAQPPTGYPDRAESWVNTGALLGRMNFALGLAHNRLRGAQVDLAGAVGGADRGQPSQVLDRLLAAVLHGEASPETRAVLAAQLGEPGDHPGHALRPGGQGHRRGEAGRARPGLARVPAEVESMSECTRRSFVKGGALALVALGAAPRFLVRTALAQERAGRPKVLVAIFQRGAVDGLSMVVPHGDPDYYDAAASIAIARPGPGVADAAIDLDGFFGLHPSLAPLKPLWDDAAPRGRPRRAARPTPRARTSTRRTTWSRARRA